LSYGKNNYQPYVNAQYYFEFSNNTKYSGSNIFIYNKCNVIITIFKYLDIYDMLWYGDDFMLLSW